MPVVLFSLIGNILFLFVYLRCFILYVCLSFFVLLWFSFFFSLALFQRASEMQCPWKLMCFKNNITRLVMTQASKSKSETGFETPTIRSVRICSLLDTSPLFFFVLKVSLHINGMQSEQVVTLRITIIFSSIEPKYIYI